MIEISLSLIAVYKNRIDRQTCVLIKGSNDANMSTPNEMFVLHRVP